MCEASRVNSSANVFPPGPDPMRPSSDERRRVSWLQKIPRPCSRSSTAHAGARLRRHAENASTASDDVRLLRVTRCRGNDAGCCTSSQRDGSYARRWKLPAAQTHVLAAERSVADTIWGMCGETEQLLRPCEVITVVLLGRRFEWPH